MELITKIGSKNFKIDLSQNRITFLDNRFYFDNAGAPVPSVTTILGCYPKSAAFYEWMKKNGENADDIRDEAGRKGSRVHDLTERYDQGEEISLLDENGYVAMSMNEWSMLEKYIEFRRRFEIQIHAIEETIVALGMGGTLDRDITLNGKRYLVDIKTSGNIWDEYWLQLAAYTKMKVADLGYNPYAGRAILWLNAKVKTEGRKDSIQGAGWQLLIKEDSLEEDWKTFEATKLLWYKINKNAMPKEMCYQLTHKLF